MTPPIKILIAEDSASDAELLLRALNRAGYSPEWQRVDTEGDFLAALHAGLDLVLSDYSMPQFTGLRALELVKSRHPEIPFIIVSGTIGEETAVEAMRLGATDYLLKDRLGRLGPAITRALELGRLRREQRASVEALRASEARYHALFDYAPDGILIADLTGVYLDANASSCRMFGYTRAEFTGLSANDIVVAEETHHIAPALAQIAAGVDYNREWLFRRKDGTTFSAEVIATAMPDGNLLAMIRDITERRHSEQRIRDQLAELLRWQEVMMGREDRVQALKAEINALLAAQDLPPRYGPEASVP
jgi:PAS domain S-box-containing protein